MCFLRPVIARRSAGVLDLPNLPAPRDRCRHARPSTRTCAVNHGPAWQVSTCPSFFSPRPASPRHSCVHIEPPWCQVGAGQCREGRILLRSCPAPTHGSRCPAIPTGGVCGTAVCSHPLNEPNRQHAWKLASLVCVCVDWRVTLVPGSAVKSGYLKKKKVSSWKSVGWKKRCVNLLQAHLFVCGLDALHCALTPLPRVVVDGDRCVRCM